MDQQRPYNTGVFISPCNGSRISVTPPKYPVKPAVRDLFSLRGLDYRYAIHEAHLPPSTFSINRGISGEQFRDNNAS